MASTRTPDAPPAPAPAPPTPPDDGIIYLDLDPVSVAYLVDRAWANEAHNTGLFAAYPVWKPFESAVTWLQQLPPAVGARRVTVLGGRWAYRLGRVRVGVIDTDRRWLPAARLNAWFLDDAPGAPRQAILGLRCHLFDRRCLGQEPAALDGALRWWLEDA